MTNVNVVELEVSRNLLETNPFYVILCSFLSFSVPHYIFLFELFCFLKVVTFRLGYQDDEKNVALRRYFPIRLRR